MAAAVPEHQRSCGAAVPAAAALSVARKASSARPVAQKYLVRSLKKFQAGDTDQFWLTVSWCRRVSTSRTC